MSSRRQQRLAQKAQRRNQRAASARQTSSRDRMRSLEAQLQEMVLDCADLALSSDVADAEFAASSLASGAWTPWLDGEEPPVGPMLAAARMVTDAARPPQAPQRVRDVALALALVLQLATLDPDDEALAREAPQLVRALRALGAADPSWAGIEGRYESVECWLVRDPWCHRQDLVIGWRAADGAEHSIMTRSSDGAWVELADVQVGGAATEFIGVIREALVKLDDERELMTIEQVSPARAGGILHGQIEATWELGGHDLRACDGIDAFAIVLARYEQLCAAHQKADADEWYDSVAPLASDLDALDADALVEAFLTSPELATVEGADTEAAEALVRWAHYAGVLRPAQFGPAQAAEYAARGLARLEDVDAEASLEETGRRAHEAIRVMQAWARFAGRHAGHSAAVVDYVVELIDSLRMPATLALAPAGVEIQAAPGMADRLVEAMQADGVEIGDQASMDAWMQSFNERTTAERDAVLGPRPD